MFIILYIYNEIFKHSESKKASANMKNIKLRLQLYRKLKEQRDREKQSTYIRIHALGRQLFCNKLINWFSGIFLVFSLFISVIWYNIIFFS